MKLAAPINRSTLLWAIWIVLLMQILWAWAFARFLHYDAQNRLLAPEHFDVQVVTADDYRKLSDPAVREVALSDGSTFIKAEVWERNVLPNYKPTADGGLYLLVTTKGTAHALTYVEHYILMFAFVAACGAGLSFWSLKLTRAEVLAQAPP
jgi:hypothetical protein